MEKDTETRGVERLPLKLEAMVCVDDAPAVLSSTRNVSRAGLFIDSRRTLAVGERVQIFLHDRRSAQIFRVNACVTHATPGVGFGVRFLTNTGQSQIDRFVALVQSGERVGFQRA
jgi:hypothetical protein